jgi:hypothetical protein
MSWIRRPCYVDELQVVLEEAQDEIVAMISRRDIIRYYYSLIMG